ncbi:MAG: hypothetical protein QME81_03995 [bacterium]|nr:hypothetical protein [bacterium]
MEPFFTDTNSKLKPLVTALIQATSSEEQDIVIASFNQSGAIAGESSPRIIYKGKARVAEVTNAVNAVTLPRRQDGKFADADFKGALNETFLNVLNRQPAIIWMITNNKNDPNNSPDIIANTSGFYQLLRDHPGIGRVIAYPVTMPSQGRYFREGGLMIYALSFGQAADMPLDQILASSNIRRLFTKPQVRIKPLTEQPVIFEPTAVFTSGIEARIDKGILVLTGLESLKQGGTISIKGKLNSNYYPQEVNSAKLSLDWASFGKSRKHGLPNKITPASLHGLPPGGIIDNIQIDIQIPPLPSLWNADTLFSNGYELSGALRITLSDLIMSLSPDFEQQMNSIFGLGQLPEIFYPDRNIRSAQTLLPVHMVVRYPVWPLAIASIAFILLAAATLAGIIILNRERRYKIEVDGQLVNVSVRPFKTKPVYSPGGAKVAELKGAFIGNPAIKSATEDVNIKIR